MNEIVRGRRVSVVLLAVITYKHKYPLSRSYVLVISLVCWFLLPTIENSISISAENALENPFSFRWSLVYEDLHPTPSFDLTFLIFSCINSITFSVLSTASFFLNLVSSIACFQSYQCHHSSLISSVAWLLCEAAGVFQLFILVRAAGWALWMVTRRWWLGHIPGATPCRTILPHALQVCLILSTISWLILTLDCVICLWSKVLLSSWPFLNGLHFFHAPVECPQINVLAPAVTLLVWEKWKNYGLCFLFYPSGGHIHFYS